MNFLDESVNYYYKARFKYISIQVDKEHLFKPREKYSLQEWLS